MIQEVKLENITKQIGTTTILENICLTMKCGQIYGITGENGSGKTMLMRVIAGLVNPSSGQLMFDGKNRVDADPNIGIMIENASLYLELSGRENLRLLASIRKRATNEEIDQAIRRVGLEPEDKRTFRKYSLGMKQRLMLAQAIMEQPEVLLLDEPTNALDESGIKLVHKILLEEIDILKIEKKITLRVKKQMNKVQKEYYLREQLKAIQKELGDDEDINSEADEYREKLNKIKAPKETKEKIAKEINKLSTISPMSPDVSVSRTYLDTVFSLPWNKETRDKIDLEKAKEILDDEHYGLEKVKERILEYLAIRKLSKSLKSPIICLVGPPGVGKTSIAKSIADSLGRKFVRISLGGVRDEAEIRGHRRTYVGAIPGRIINGLKEAQTKNPVFLLDEIDKMSSDYKGDPASAMLEVLDPGQNKDFVDHYVEVPFDLSKILFVTTANSLSTIPRPLLDRMEIIEVSGYIEEEKLNIVKKYLLPKQLKEHALEADFIKMDDEVIRDIIDSYTREAGVRNLERTIGKICRKVAKKYVENPSLEGVVITKADLDEYLGKNRYRHQLAGTKPEVGIVTGLAWTAVGGETLTAEVNVLKGKGQVVLTGKLGTVMKESAQTGISYIRSIADRFDIDPDFYTKNDIHIHLPEGAVPKDGPSAGITMALAVLSALTNIPVRNNVAMTGEITLRGRVLAVGGIKEKLLAAHRAGITKVLLPKECEADLEEIPQNVKEQMEFVLVEHMDEVLEHALLRNGEQ